MFPELLKQSSVHNNMALVQEVLLGLPRLPKQHAGEGLLPPGAQPDWQEMPEELHDAVQTSAWEDGIIWGSDADEPATANRPGNGSMQEEEGPKPDAAGRRS